MRGIILTILALSLSIGLMAQTLSCKDVQQTTNPNGDSIYKDQVITVQGIVTGVKSGTGFFIGDEEGGEWSGLYIFHGNTSNNVAVGDLVVLTGLLVEFYNMTELTQVSSYSIISSNNAVPITTLTTSQLPFGAATSEVYEGVMVRFNDVQIKSTIDSYGQFKVADSSGVQAMIDDLFYPQPASQIVVGQWWYQIQGIVDYHSAAGYKVSPRSPQDMIKTDDITNSQIRIGSAPNAIIGQISTVDVYTTKLNASWGVREYSMTIHIDPTMVIYQGYDIEGTLTNANPTINVSSAGDQISIQYGAQEGLVAPGEASLIKLKFEPLNYGDITIDLTEFMYDDTPITSLGDGRIQVRIAKNIAYLNISRDGSGKNSFDPSMNEKIKIEYGTKTGFLARALVRIYDAQGRLVATPVHQNFTSSTGIESYLWDGRDSNMDRVKPGLYYCHLEVSNRESGKRYDTVQPIVVKSRLN